METKQVETYNLSVETSDEGAEIFILNSQFQRVASDTGKSAIFKLKEGLYTIKVAAGCETIEKSIALLSKDETVVFNPVAFPSPAPLEETSRTHEDHIKNAVDHSHHVHIQIGHGSQIYVFARVWTKTFPSGLNPHIEDPSTGLTLRDVADQILVDFGRPEIGFNSATSDPWSACNVELNPGVYILCLETKGKTFKQVIAASPSWQTQVFLLKSDRANSEDFECDAGLSNASIFMAELGTGFRSSRKENLSSDPDFRLTEIARQALISNRPVLRQDLLYQMLDDKFKNPMLGIYGCHLLLLNKKTDKSMLPRIISNLRRLVIDPHPEIEALAVKLDMDTSYVFNVPPMLRQSWNYILEASVRKTDLIPENSLTSRIAGNLWSGNQWLVWGGSSFNTDDYLKDQLRNLSAFNIFLPEDVSSRSFDTTLNFDMGNHIPASLELDEEKMKLMVQALGVPRSKLDAAIHSIKSNIK